MTDQEFLDKLKANYNPVVVDFWAPWCGPCTAIEPMIERLEKEFSGTVDVWRVNADEQPQLLRNLKVYGIPTIIAFNQGDEVGRQTGVGSLPSLVSLFEAAQTGKKLTKKGISNLDRLLRLGMGVVLLILSASGRFEGMYLWIAGLAVITLISGLYDLSPFFMSLVSKFKKE